MMRVRCRGQAVGLAAVFLLWPLLGGCDSFSNLAVNCQIGAKNSGDYVAACEFNNTGRKTAESCVKVHLQRPEKLVAANHELPETIVSERVCSGEVAPGEATEPKALSFGEYPSPSVAEACIERADDGTPQFQCQIKIEEVP